LIETSRDAGDEGSRDEDRGENQRNADNGAGDLLHGFESGFLWRETIFDVALDGFDDDDGVIDDEADGQNQAEQRERVDGKAE